LEGVEGLLGELADQEPALGEEQGPGAGETFHVLETVTVVGVGPLDFAGVGVELDPLLPEEVVAFLLGQDAVQLGPAEGLVDDQLAAVLPDGIAAPVGDVGQESMGPPGFLRCLRFAVMPSGLSIRSIHDGQSVDWI
jgi:hypothetical protein